MVIDDIDRLIPSEVQELFQLIKVNADFPNVVYLVLFDRSVVEKNIEKVVAVSGRDYLEKIVQVGFTCRSSNVRGFIGFSPMDLIG